MKTISPEIATAVNRLTELLNKLPEQLAAIPTEVFNTSPVPGKWSKQQIVGHLIDSAANNHQRFIRAQYESVPPRIVYEQTQWNMLSRYDTANREDLIGLLCLYNRQLLHIIEHITEENLHKHCYTTNDEPHTLSFLINDYVSHFEHHIKQILS